MKELSVFVDESGDFGDYDYRSPFYIISLVLHDQSVSIERDLKVLENELANIGWAKHCVHAGPVIRSEEEYHGYDIIKVYYDNGQIEVIRILSSVFNSLLENVEFHKVIPADYRLFQVADLICTLKLSELKMNMHQLSKSEKYFFNDERTLRKNYLKPLSKKAL